MAKKLIQIDMDNHYVSQFYHACLGFSDKIEYVGRTADYISVCNLPPEQKSSIEIIIVCLQIMGTDVQTMVTQLRMAYPRAFIVGVISGDHAHFSQLQSVALSSGANKVMIKITQYHTTIQEIIAEVYKPVNQMYIPPQGMPQMVPSVPMMSTHQPTMPNETGYPSASPYVATTTQPMMPTRTMEEPTVSSQPTSQIASIVPKMIAISGSKGGIGKTTVSVEIATALALVKNKQIKERLKVCLVDMDLDYGDETTLFNIKTANNLYSWVQDIDEMAKTIDFDRIKFNFDHIVDRYLKVVPTSGLYLLPATMNPLQSAYVREEHIKVILNHLKQHFHYVILDLGNNTRDFTIIGLHEANEVILVVDFDNKSVKSLKTMIETLRHINFPTNHYKFIINKVEQGVGIDLREIKEMIESKLGLKYIGSLPYLKTIKKTQNECKQMMGIEENEFTASLKNIISEISPVFEKSKTAHIDSSSKSGVFTSIKRLFGIG